jgi:hypothetical protein
VIAPADSFTKVDIDVTKGEIEPIAASVVPVTLARRMLDKFGPSLKSGEWDRQRVVATHAHAPSPLPRHL